MRILQIQSDGGGAQSVELMLKADGFATYTTDLGEEGVDLAKIYDYDLVLLDTALPDMSGLDVLRQMRSARLGTPVIMMSADSSVETKVRAFSLGADDYITKPFHRDELVQRIRAVVRRSKGHPESIITTGSVVVNLGRKTVEVGDRRVHLTGKEYQMMELLSLRRGLCLTKEMFMNHLYSGMDEPELKIIDVFVCKLRKKLAQAGASGIISTVWGRGYRLDTPPPDAALA